MIQLKLLSAGFLVLGVCQVNASTYETNFSKIAGHTLGTILADSGHYAAAAGSDANAKKRSADETEADETDETDETVEDSDPDSEED